MRGPPEVFECKRRLKMNRKPETVQQVQRSRSRSVFRITHVNILDVHIVMIEKYKMTSTSKMNLSVSKDWDQR